MARYKYKAAIYREDFAALVNELLENWVDDHGYEFDYDMDYWLVAKELLERKDTRITQLEAALRMIANSWSMPENRTLIEIAQNALETKT